MPPSGSPTVRRRRLAVELRRLRGNRTGTEVSRAIGWSPTKISRAESGRESLPPPEVEKLLDYYGVTEPHRGQLLSLAEDAVQRGWWDDYADVLAPEYLEFIGLEAEATSISHWQSDVVPGLLQTEEYARQMSVGYQSVMPTPSRVINELVRVRMIRQQRLTREPVLKLFTVIDEAVLLRTIGNRGVMRAQLKHLMQVADLPNVDLRILPLDRSIMLVTSSFAMLSFGSRAAGASSTLSDVVNIESLKSEVYIEGETELLLYRIFFDAFTEAALSPEDSKLLLRTTADRTV
ncbi:MAG TPA: helix-turn-helix transcriptional regulator [Trebonia sp.]|nr:helix-turn-helix transcriptional regulator [Trebonia sp.]